MNYWSLFLLILPIWAIFGNTLVIFSVYKEKTLHGFTNYLVVNLAIADLMVALFAMPFHIYVSVNEDWDLGNVFCDISLSIDSCTAIVSKFTLVAISVERYIAVLKPIKYRFLQIQYKPVNRFLLVAFFIWMFSLAITLPFLFGLNSLPERVSTICTFYNNRYTIGASIFTFWIPALILVIMYYKIIRTIRQRVRRVSKQNCESPNNTNTSSNLVAQGTDHDVCQISGEIEHIPNENSIENRMKKFERNTTITIGIVLTVFFICWAPFYGTLLTEFIYLEVHHEKHNGYWYRYYLYTGWIGYFNSCLNMIIYSFFNPQFKEAYKKHFFCLFSR